MTEGSPRALVAVPDDLYRIGLSRLLRDNGIDVVAHVGSARNAAELVRELRPDVVLLELRAQHVGSVAIAQLRDLESPPAVLALSNSPSHAEAVEALAAGASGYLAKHAEPAAVAGAIRALGSGGLFMPWYVADELLAPVREAQGPPCASEAEDGPLTAREVDVLHLMARGLANDEIGRELVVTRSTVKNHVTRIVAKLGARNRTHAAVLAVHRRYI